MLTQATKKCQRQDQRLVLVVDGLDEDRGVTTGSDAQQHCGIAASPADSWVAGHRRRAARPTDPFDVPDDHPLRDPGIVRVLDGSRWAAVVKADMQRELKRLLHGSPAERDLLGLVATPAVASALRTLQT